MTDENATRTCPTCGDQESPLWLGVQVRGEYDGILIWVCSNGHQFPRFQPDDPSGFSRLHDRAVEIIADWKILEERERGSS